MKGSIIMILGAFWDNAMDAVRQTGKTTAAIIDALRGMGYEEINVNLGTIADPAELRAELEKGGMSVGDAFDRIELTRLPRDNGEADRRFEMSCALGAKRFLFIPGQYGDAPKAEVDAALCEGLAWASERAAAYGLQPAIEAFDVGYTPLCHAEVIAMALNAAPKLRLALDTGNYLHGGYDALKELRALRGRLADSVHLKDRTKRAGGGDEYRTLSGEIWYPCAAGDGDMRISEVIAELKSCGFDGTLYAEQYGSGRQLEDLTRSAEFIRREWNKTA